MIAVSSHTLRLLCHRSLGWLALAAFVGSLPGVSWGVLAGALDLLDAHQVIAGAAQGKDVVVVLHHDGRHSHSHSRTAHPNEEGANGALGGCVPDEDHELLLPGALDAAPRGQPAVVRAPQVVERVFVFGPEIWRVHLAANERRMAMASGGAQPRAGPPAGLRTTELRI